MANLQKEEALYFIALVPPEPFKTELWQQKVYMRDHYGSKASLNSPAHITLHMPFRLKEKREAALIEALAGTSRLIAPIQVELKNYAAFPPRVIYVDVMPNQPLQQLQKAVHQCLKKEFYTFNANYKDRGFHPHITLAFRDLKKASFTEAWKELKEKQYVASWLATNITLLKHAGRQWEEHAQLSFGESA